MTVADEKRIVEDQRRALDEEIADFQRRKAQVILVPHSGAYIMFGNFYFLPVFLLKTCQFCRKVSTRAVAGLRPLLYFPKSEN